MKKVLASILVLALAVTAVFAFASCGGDKDNKNTDPATPSNTKIVIAVPNSQLNLFGHGKTDDCAVTGACHHAHAHYSCYGNKCVHCVFSISLSFMSL